MSQIAATGTIIGSTTTCLTLTVAVPEWRKRNDLLCLQDNLDLFVPENYGPGHRDQINEAKAICNVCPVRQECLDWAVPQAQLDGIWGAKTPPERTRIRTGRA